MREGVDFYYDASGLMVFTETYHIERGHCCGSGCRHCPYGPSPEALNASPRLRATLFAPIGSPVHSEDTQIITRRGWYQLFTPGSPDPAENEVLFSHIDPKDVVRTVEETVAAQRKLGLPLKWSIGLMTSPGNLEAELAKRTSISWDYRGMLIETATKLAVNDRCVIERVDSKNIEEFIQVSATGWEMPGVRPQYRRKIERMVAHPLCRLFLARVDGKAVGTAATVLKHDCGFLISAVVLKEARGCGAYRALVEARLADLRELGIPWATSWARGSTSAPILEKLGFETVFRAKMYKFEP